ncbi:hypothetical protein EYF80_064503 [Liparis tanakae]|uniref:Uncharacterized protein n=1 Tax=Liparis tanakae TaxID=230148 RepID=A0A4Z2E992_9TELE|nr:hypothetical protein EYF80_064503 [Liparis tanakae]
MPSRGRCPCSCLWVLRRFRKAGAAATLFDEFFARSPLDVPLALGQSNQQLAKWRLQADLRDLHSNPGCDDPIGIFSSDFT